MKQHLKNFIIYFTIVIFLVTSCPFAVYASEHGGGGGTDHNSSFITDSGTINVKDDGVVMYYIEYIISQIGAIICDHDITKAMANDQTMKEYISKGKYDANKKTVVFPKETIVYVKQCLDQYAKENEPYYIVPISSYRDIDPSSFTYKAMYSTICQLARSYGLISVNGGGSHVYISDMSDVASKGHSFVCTYIPSNTNWSNTECWASMYNSNWQGIGSTVKRFDFDASMTVGYTSFDDGKTLGTEYNHTWHSNFGINIVVCRKGRIKSENSSISDFVSGSLVAKESQRIRVYKTVDDYKRYSVGKRSVYYTENYYNYVPDDLTTSIDDLQKSVDDLQDVVDELTDQIGNDTSESEIEELLKQILEELKKNPGTGDGGGGGSGGDVTVDIDLSTTNGLLSKILAKVTQIFDKISETAGGAVDAVNTKLQETLDEILSTLKSIRRWTIADTVFDGIDTVADVASLLKDFLTAPAAAIGTAASSLGETASMLTDKFPFSIPWDMAALVTLLSAEPQAPVFKLPIMIESAGIEEYIEIDMSQFEYLSTLMRGMLSILYAYGILSMTTKVMDIGGKK